MPNWCHCVITIDKATDEQIERIRAAVTADRLLDEFFPEPDWRQIPNEDGHLPGPQYARWIKGSAGPARNWPESPRFPNGQYDQRWYQWRTQQDHWSCKWDISGATMEFEDSVLTINCETPWSPPSAAWFEKLSQAMPNAVINNIFEEPGCDFFGVTLARGGNAVLLSRDIEPIREEFYKEKLTAEQQAILNNEDHEEYDEVYELANDLWWNEESDRVGGAADELFKEAEDQIASLQQTTA